jgi:uncharacterized membrane protein
VTLALVPLGLALVVFRPRARLRVAWWIGAGLFVAFLPNAPYVLTDLVHLGRDWDVVRAPRAVAQVLVGLPERRLALVSMFALFCGLITLTAIGFWLLDVAGSRRTSAT